MLLLLAMPVAAYFFVFQPRNEQIEQARREIKQKQGKLDQLQAVTKNIKNLGEEIDSLSAAIKLFEEKLPAQREVEVILKQVWELAAKHQLIPKSIRTDKPSATVMYAELPINMTIVGDFDGFYSFLLDLEKLQRITRIPFMALTRGKKLADGQMEAQLVLNIFFEATDEIRAESKRRRGRRRR